MLIVREFAEGQRYSSCPVGIKSNFLLVKSFRDSVRFFFSSSPSFFFDISLHLLETIGPALFGQGFSPFVVTHSLLTFSRLLKVLAGTSKHATDTNASNHKN